ncbi:hypothetical protein SEUCBS140593_003698 [Sporothrix eucalyptigena]|uniref:GATA-type domain-containing protein n=1 Tax=Sporothrix eucalyptigena TaxID=1812306 RepID=A0ABP0BGY8_9PEZI
MATAALISPNTPYYPHHPPSSYSSGSYYQGQQGQQQQQQQQQGSQGHHSHHQHAHSHGQASPTAATAGMISPVESRRTSDDHDMAGSGGHRQSLPSLKDIIGKNTSSGYHHSPSHPPSSTTPSGPPPQQSSLPSPFSTTAPPRPFPAESPSDMQHHSPQTMQHSAPYSQRPEPSSSFPAPPRPPLSRRSSPPPPGESSHSQQAGSSSMQSVLHSQPPPPQHAPMYPPHPSQHSPHPSHHQRPQEQPPYHHGPPPPRDGRPHDDSPPPHHAYPPHQQHHQQHPPYPPQSSSQQPLPPPPPNQSHMSYPGSPRQSGPPSLPSLPSPFEAHPPPMQEHSGDFNRSRTRYDQTLSRHFESWNYTEYLARIGSNSRTIYNFAEAFGSLAREEHGPHPMPGRMPSDREVLEMISNAEWLKTMLESLRHMVHEVNKGRSGGGNGGESGSGAGNGGRQKNVDDMDMPMYNEQSNKPYGMEVKKRRGRAAPPGRCHSCNRIDTPEWRRGPDGARTLCNACGLHYAKLERKKQLESRQIRPKHPDAR